MRILVLNSGNPGLMPAFGPAACRVGVLEMNTKFKPLALLSAGAIAGVLVSIFQTITSIQDNVLAFIPRAAAIFVVFALTFPWMLRMVSSFAISLFNRLPELAR